MAGNTIKLAVYGIPPVEIEATADEKIIFGQLVEWQGNGNMGLATGFGEQVSGTVAVENIFDGTGLGSNNVASASSYASGETGFFIQSRRGDVMWMWLQSGENVSIGDKLTSAGVGATSGNLIAQTAATQYVIGTALETLDLTALATSRIKVEIA